MLWERGVPGKISLAAMQGGMSRLWKFGTWGITVESTEKRRGEENKVSSLYLPPPSSGVNKCWNDLVVCFSVLETGLRLVPPCDQEMKGPRCLIAVSPMTIHSPMSNPA